MGKKSRVKTARTAAAATGRRGRPPPALPVRLRPPVQGLPRQPRRPAADVRRPALRGTRGRVRPDRAARDRPRRDRAAAADGLGDDRPVLLCSLLPMAAPALVRAGRHALARPAGAAQLRRPEPRPRRRARAGARGRTRRGRRAHRPARRGPAAAGPAWPTSRSRSPCTTASTSGSPTSTTRPVRWPPRWSAANAAAIPTVRLTSVEAAYWTDVGTKEHLRWVMPYDEEQLLDALARLHVAGKDSSPRARAWSGCSARTACSSRCGTCPSGPARRCSRSPPPQFAKDLEAALADGVAADRGGAGGPHRAGEPTAHDSVT